MKTSFLLKLIIFCVATLSVLPADAADEVDATTLNNKLLFGYQGWFAAKNDGSGMGWNHWFRNNEPSPANAVVDFLPDMSEFAANEKFATGMKTAAGNDVFVHSAYRRATVVRHCKWMADCGLDGVMLIRFTSQLKFATDKKFRDSVLTNLRAGAEAHGRVYCVRYNITMHDDASLYSTITNDWKHLVDNLKTTSSPRYLRHNSLPVVSIYGIGFANRTPATAATITKILDFFQKNDQQKYRATIVAGVPSYWRTLDRDSHTGDVWRTIYARCDVLQPWMVARFNTDAGMDNFVDKTVKPDLAEAKKLGVGYMACAFPGFSWAHLQKNVEKWNIIPRNGGVWYWRQVNKLRAAGVTMLFNANFDEVDEGTAMFKQIAAPDRLPAGPDPYKSFVPLNVDGYELPSDFYLWLAGKATDVLRGSAPNTATIPALPSVQSVSFDSSTVVRSRKISIHSSGPVAIYISGENLFTTGGYKLNGLDKWPLPEPGSTPQLVVLKVPVDDMKTGALTLRVRTYDKDLDPLTLELVDEAVATKNVIAPPRYPGESPPSHSYTIGGRRLPDSPAHRGTQRRVMQGVVVEAGSDGIIRRICLP